MPEEIFSTNTVMEWSCSDIKTQTPMSGKGDKELSCAFAARFPLNPPAWTADIGSLVRGIVDSPATRKSQGQLPSMIGTPPLP